MKVLLLVVKNGEVRRYTGESLRQPVDFHAFRVGDRLICIMSLRAVSYRRVHEYDALLGAYSFLKSQEGVRALEIKAAKDVSRREVVRLFQQYAAS